MKEPKRPEELLDELLKCEDKVSIAAMTNTFMDFMEYAKNTSAGQLLNKLHPKALNEMLWLTMTSFILSAYTRDMSEDEAKAFSKKALAIEVNARNLHTA